MELAPSLQGSLSPTPSPEESGTHGGKGAERAALVPGRVTPFPTEGCSSGGLAARLPREEGSLAQRPPPSTGGCCRGGQAPEPREGGHLRPGAPPSLQRGANTDAERGGHQAHPHTPPRPDADAARGWGCGSTPGRRRGAWRRARGRGRAPPGGRRAPGPHGGGGAAPAMSRQAAGSQGQEAAGKAVDGAGGGGEGVWPSRA